MTTVRGYKVFDPDFTCRGYQFAEGKTYTHEGPVSLCNSGFHFCLSAGDCFSYYSFDPKNIVCEIEAEGVSEETEEDSKRACDKITVVRRLTWEEVLRVANSGFGNSGNRNSGDYNSGSYNSGDYNSGDYNSGYYNSGDYNSGYYNSGNRNSGNRNSGNRNSGDYNSGNRNSGSYNSGNRNSGHFNTDAPKLRLFNVSTDLDLGTINLPYLDMPVSVTWVGASDMSAEEKTKYPQHTTISGYLKAEGMPIKKAFPIAWVKAGKSTKKQFVTLPHFDAAIFEECTGVKLTAEEIKDILS